MAVGQWSHGEEKESKIKRAAELRERYNLKNSVIATRMSMSLSWVTMVLGPDKRKNASDKTLGAVEVQKMAG